MPRVNQLITVTTPRGPLKTGRFVQSHTTAFGEWWEIAPTAPNGKSIKDHPTFRARPKSCSIVSK